MSASPLWSSLPGVGVRRILWAGGLVLSVVAGLIAAASLPLGMSFSDRSAHVAEPPAYPITRVSRGVLESKVAEQGTVDSSNNIVVASDCEWTARIIELVPEGSWVYEGQVVVQMDTAELVQRKKEKEITLIAAESALVQAREVVRLQEVENESSLAKAKIARHLAELDLKKYIEGEYPRLLKEAEGAVALAEEDVARAKDRLEFTERMARKGYDSPVSVEREQLSVFRYETGLINAQNALDVLVNHTKGRTLAELTAKARDAELELKRVEQIADMALANRQLQVATRESNLQAMIQDVERLQKSIDACMIRAPKTGEIIYANEGSVRNEVILGEYIRHHQDVVRVPDLTQMKVDVRIHESLIDGIRPGLTAAVTVDAYPDVPFRGTLESVSRVPTTPNSYYYAPDVKEYDAIIRIDATPKELEILKPGMTAQVDILLERLEDCVYVPIQAVVDVAGRAMTFVSTPEGIRSREVTLGLMTSSHAEILDGLSEGETLVLTPRATCAEMLHALEDQFTSETNAQNIGG
jgi:HlyD family secretion protein